MSSGRNAISESFNVIVILDIHAKQIGWYVVRCFKLGFQMDLIGFH